MKKNLFVLVLIILATAFVGYLYLGKGNSTLKVDQTNFAVEDTASVTKIFLADNKGNTIKLSRENKTKWTLNDSLSPRPGSLELVLKTLHSLKIKSPIAAAQHAHYFKRIAVNHVKIEVYTDNEDDPYKTIYISDSKTDMSGNLALLETEEFGRSNTPYYVHMEGHRGVLRPIFFTHEGEWTDTEIFAYNPANIKSIELVNYKKPELSFKVEQNAKGIAVFDIKNQQYLPNIDTLMVFDYIKTYRKVHYEIDDYVMTKSETDSIINSEPRFRINVTDKSGEINTIALYPKPELIRTIEFTADLGEEDIDRLYGYYKGKLVICQYYNFNKLLYSLDNFKR